MPPTSAIAWCDRHADAQTAVYEAMPAAAVHGGLAELLPAAPGLVLNVGAGSGRDAAWLADLGHDVVTIGPLTTMQRGAVSRHASARSPLPAFSRRRTKGVGVYRPQFLRHLREA